MRYSHLQVSHHCIESYQRHDGEFNNFEWIRPEKDLIIFRGTDEGRDVLTDFRLLLYWRFLRYAARPLYEHLADQVHLLDLPLTFGGHSLGAELAKVMGAMFIRDFGPSAVDQIVAFAPPRTWKRWDLQGRPYTGYRNGFDVVTYGPGIRHQEELVQLARPSIRIVTRHKMSEYNQLMKRRFA